MRVLVTGASGFVGGRLLTRLLAAGEHDLFALSRRPPAGLPSGVRDTHGAVRWRSVDLSDRTAVIDFVAEARPERVFHLAAVAHPGECSKDPAAALRVQVGGTAAVLAATPPGARVVLVSTSQVYGPAASPIDERTPLRAVSAYGRSKRAAERAARAFPDRELVVARPFNHSGPGQSERYVLPALARSLRSAVRAGEPMRTGNLFPKRDFLHVDDVLDAYELLAEKGAPGVVYNVGRGEGTSIGELVERMQQQLGTSVETVLDPERARPDDPPEIVADATRLRALGWAPRRPLDLLVGDVLADLERGALERGHRAAD